MLHFFGTGNNSCFSMKPINYWSIWLFIYLVIYSPVKCKDWGSKGIFADPWQPLANQLWQPRRLNDVLARLRATSDDPRPAPEDDPRRPNDLLVRLRATQKSRGVALERQSDSGDHPLSRGLGTSEVARSRTKTSLGLRGSSEDDPRRLTGVIVRLRATQKSRGIALERQWDSGDHPLARGLGTSEVARSRTKTSLGLWGLTGVLVRLRLWPPQKSPLRDPWRLHAIDRTVVDSYLTIMLYIVS